MRGLRQGCQVLCSSLTPSSKEEAFTSQVYSARLKGLRWASHLSLRTMQKKPFPHKPTQAHPATHTRANTRRPTCLATPCSSLALSIPPPSHPSPSPLFSEARAQPQPLTPTSEPDARPSLGVGGAQQACAAGNVYLWGVAGSGHSHTDSQGYCPPALRDTYQAHLGIVQVLQSFIHFNFSF